MKLIGWIGCALLGAVVLAGCTAAAPASVNPPAATEADVAVMTAPTEPPPTATPAPPPPTATLAVPTATPEPEPEPTTEPANTELAYRAQSGPRPAPPAPPVDGSLLTINRGPSQRLEVALTFDAGADAGYAAEILDLLRDEGIKATFGMTGAWAADHPELIQRMATEGHQLINHTWSHDSFTGFSTGADPMTYEQMLQELSSTEQLIWDLTGYEMKPYVRPPYGDIGPMTSGFLIDAGYYINVMWTCDSYGWKGWDAAQIVSHCTTDIGPGEIILMHVGASAAGDYESLPGMISFFRNQGYSFVTIEQMLQP